MRALGYLILLTLALYFLVVKPYLVAKRISIELEGLALSFERGLSLRIFLLHLPLKDNTLHILVKDASIKPWSLRLGEFNLIEVSKAPPSDKPFDYDFGPIVKLAKKLNLRVDSLYISTNYIPKEESLTLFVPRTQLELGRIYSSGWAQVYWRHQTHEHHLEVLLKRAHIEGSKLILEEAQVRSNLYAFSIGGVWEGKRGSFKAEGYIKPIEGNSFYLARTDIRLQGAVGYTSIRSNFLGFSEKLDIRGRGEFRNLRVEGQYLWKWRGKSHVKALVKNGFTHVEVDYSLNDDILHASFKGFPVDSKLLGVSQNLSATAAGELQLDMNKKFLVLQAYSPLAQFENQRLMGLSLKVSMSYKEYPQGNLELSVAQPFSLSLRGSFHRSDFSGDIGLVGYELKEEGLVSKVSYKGSIRVQQGQIFSHGRGNLDGLVLRDINLGRASYDLSLEGDTYRINLVGNGYTLLGGGSIKKRDFSGRLRLEDLNLSYSNINLRSLRGNVMLHLEGKVAQGSGRVEGNLSKDDLTSWVGLSFHLERVGEELKGHFRGDIKDAKAFQFSYPRGSFEGRLEGEKLFLSFNLQDYLTGRGYYDYKTTSFDFEGRIKQPQGDLLVNSKYRLKGAGEDIDLELLGDGKYRNFSFPLRASLRLEKGRLEGFLRGFNLREGLVDIQVPEVRIRGSKEKGILEVEPIVVIIGQQQVSKVEFQRGEYTGKTLSLRGNIQGILEGWLEFSYDKGPSFYSEGVLHLSRLFSVIRSRVLADAEGRVAYRLSYREALSFRASSDRITLRSRYIAVPLSGRLEINFQKDRLSGFVELRGNQRSSILANFRGSNKLADLSFEISQLPFLYRSDAIRTNLIVSGKGNIRSDYKDLNIQGQFYTSGVVNLQRIKGESGKAPEEYKRVKLDISLLSSEPLRVVLPEGSVYTDLSVKVGGSLYQPDYSVKAYLKGGRLTYFEREFYVRRGELTLTNKDSQMDLTIIAPTPDYSIIIDLKGNPQYPKAIIRSEPPRDIREVLTTLVLGGAETEGLIPIGSALISQLPQISGLLKGARGMTGLDIKVQVSPSVSPTGEVGLNVTVSKEINQRITVEHRQSTLKNPKETYTGVDARLTQNTSIGGRYYSDKSQEVRMRLRKKFDF